MTSLSKHSTKTPLYYPIGRFYLSHNYVVCYYHAAWYLTEYAYIYLVHNNDTDI